MSAWDPVGQCLQAMDERALSRVFEGECRRTNQRGFSSQKQAWCLDGWSVMACAHTCEGAIRPDKRAVRQENREMLKGGATGKAEGS